MCVSYKGPLTLINFCEKHGQLDLMALLKNPMATVVVRKTLKENQRGLSIAG